ncbi:MAG: lysylphosphatidylglycerol synthase domain-containing protein [Cellulomonas sp.]
MPVSEQPPPPTRMSRRPARGRRLLRWVALLAVLFFAVAYVTSSWDGITTSVARLDGHAVLGALGLVGVGLVSAMLSWRAVLGGLGSRLPLLAAARVYFLGQLGKYVPGSVWPILAQAELSNEYGVPRTRAGFAAITQMLIGLVVGIAVAAVSLATAAPGALVTYWWLGVVAAAGVVALVPAVFNRASAVALRLARRTGEQEPLTARSIGASAAWCLVMWLAFGAQIWLMARGLGTTSSTLFALAVGGYALAWVVGFVIIVLPAGAGAREAALVIALAPVLDRDNAIALALVSRFLMLLGDAGGAGIAVVAERLHVHRHPRATPPRPAPSPE